MEPIVYRLRKRTRYAPDAHKVVYTSACNRLKPAELAQQIAAPFRPEPHDFVEW